MAGRHGSLAKAGKVRKLTPKVAVCIKKKKATGRGYKRMLYNRRFGNVVNKENGPKRGPNYGAGQLKKK